MCLNITQMKFVFDLPGPNKLIWTYNKSPIAKKIALKYHVISTLYAFLNAPVKLDTLGLSTGIVWKIISMEM